MSSRCHYEPSPKLTLGARGRRFVNIESPSPFARASSTLDPDHSLEASSVSSFDSASSIPIYSPRTHKKVRSASMKAAEEERKAALSDLSLSSATPERPGSTWRPPNDDSPVRVIHLGTNFEPHERRNGKGSAAAATRDRPTSAHSLKTLPRGGGKAQPSPLGPKRTRGDEEEEESEGEAGDSRFQTMASYRTAHEGEGSEEIDGETRNRKRGEDKRPLGEVFSSEEGSSAQTKEDHEAVSRSSSFPDGLELNIVALPQLAKALKKLVDSMQMFKLEPVGPIVADLGESSG